MKKLAFIMLSMAVMSCSSETKEKETENPAVQAEETAEIKQMKYGSDISEDNAEPAANLMATMAADSADSVRIKLVGTIEKVCQVKGCWMTMRVSEEETMHVSFKDYGFFVPKDIDGKECIIDGYAYMETMSVDELRHYAEDEGKTADEIALITEPETNLSFVADGVIVKDYEVSDETPTEEDASEDGV